MQRCAAPVTMAANDYMARGAMPLDMETPGGAHLEHDDSADEDEGMDLDRRTGSLGASDPRPGLCPALLPGMHDDVDPDPEVCLGMDAGDTATGIGASTMLFQWSRATAQSALRGVYLLRPARARDGARDHWNQTTAPTASPSRGTITRRRSKKAESRGIFLSYLGTRPSASGYKSRGIVLS